LPNSVFELDYGVLNEKGDSDIGFNGHLILELHEDFAIFTLLTAKLLGDKCHVENINLFIDGKLSSIVS
jgi:hypothetical protein